MSEDSPVYHGPTIVVATDDGTLFSCAPFEIGGVSTPRQVRWTLIDARGLECLGPAHALAKTPQDGGSSRVVRTKEIPMPGRRHRREAAKLVD